MTGIEFLDQFMTTHKHRGAFNRTEIVDFLLDLRLILTSTGGANGSIQEEPAASDRPHPDDSELANSGSEVV